MTTIKLPATFTADVVEELPANGRWKPGLPQFIVLKFGWCEVIRWEWQADYPLEQRREPDEEDVQEFVADKIANLFKGANL